MAQEEAEAVEAEAEGVNQDPAVSMVLWGDAPLREGAGCGGGGGGGGGQGGTGGTGGYGGGSAFGIYLWNTVGKHYIIFLADRKPLLTLFYHWVEVEDKEALED